MKNVLKFVIILCFVLVNTAIFAQKFGHIDSQELLKLMPETKVAQEQLEKESKEVEGQYEVMTVEYNNKLLAWQEDEKKSVGDAGKWSPAIKSDKQQELMQLQERIQNFQYQASESLQNRKAELMKPILEKIDNAIKKVSETNDFWYIFDVNAVIYYNPKKSIDILPMVKKELNL